MWKKENLRKNFLRVKQIADQNLGRAEKSEVLTEDQQGNEKRVDTVRQVSHNLIKKVTALLEAPPGTDPEKRLKKLPETSLSHSLIESATLLGLESLLGSLCQQCGECQSVLAREELQCELDIEREVLTPLQTIAEVDIPSIMKLRKHLNKSTLDMDSAKNRFNSAVRQSHVPGANMASAAAKADAVREEFDEACNKVESIKDNLSIELCNFISKESEHSSRLVALLESQAAYHKKALQAIEETIPKMKKTIEMSPAKPLFGMQLEEHLRVMGRDISLVLEACIITLLDTGMEEEGLFRIAGSSLKLKKLKACFDAHAFDMEEFSTDPHTVAGVMKQYLRELPEPMLTFNLHQEFMQATQLPQDQRFQALYTAVNKLPPINYNNIRYLVKFLALLAEKSHINKMTPSNIAIVMGPNLLWAKGETTPNMLTAGAVSSIIEAFILHADYFFPGELDFHLTGLGCAPPSPSAPAPSTTKEPPVVTVSEAHCEQNATKKKDEGVEQRAAAQPRESTLVQMAAGDTAEASAYPGTRSENQERESEPAVEILFTGSGPGEGGMSTHCGDGVLHTLAPTNLSLAGSHARQRPIMPAPGPPVSVVGATGPCSSQDSLLSTGTARSTPNAPTSPSQSVHSDMYSTLFALHSLAEGGAVWSDYLTRVRALWDGQFQSASLPPLSGEGQKVFVPLAGRTGQEDPSPSVPSSEPILQAASERAQATADGSAEKRCQGRSPNPKSSQEIDFSVTGAGYPADSPAQDHYPEVSIMSMSSPSVITHSPFSNSGSHVTNSASPAAESLSPSHDSPEGPQLSPKIQRRVTKKPAPPPPPDRSYAVAVTASMSRGTGNGDHTSQTWPRNTSIPSPEPQPDGGSDRKEGDKRHSPPERRISGHDRPHGPPPERPSAPPPERPKVPPTLQSSEQHPPGVPGGHQRSASTGAMYITTSADPNPGSTSHESLQAGMGTSLTAGPGNVLPSGTSTLGRHSSMRPPRPNPPPPPPPINQQTEETHL